MSQLRKIRYRLFSWRRFPPLKPSLEAIDVVIPIIAKDLHILPLCLEGVRHCVSHPIEQIYIVAPAETAILQFCQEHGVQFVNEASIFGFPPKALQLIIRDSQGRTRDRSGWLFQQLVKLSGKVGTCRHYLCIDADHVLIHPHVFLTDDERTVFYMSYEEHQPYYDNINRLIPTLSSKGLSPLSYVAHKMLFDKEQLQILHQKLTGQYGLPWIETIVQSYDRQCHAGFSEFELYGNFVTHKVLRPWLQKRLPYHKLADYDTLQRKYSNSRWSLTFPDYMRQNNNNRCISNND